MLLSILNLVGGTAVGSQTYDSIFNDQARENLTNADGSEGSVCPITADCVGVPGGVGALYCGSACYWIW